VGLLDGELLLNPSASQAALSELRLTYAGASGGRALMVEAAGDQVRRALCVGGTDRTMRLATGCVQTAV
jgi:polyribonucleotide nucleotidyltransferase